MDCFYIELLSKALYNIACHSPIHAHMQGGVNQAVRYRCLAKGHLDTLLGGACDRTINIAITSQPTLPPELLLHLYYFNTAIQKSL